jgi:nicotinamidase-related amidase
MKKTLVIVDFQNDFCNPKGSLYVDGASMAKEAIMKYIKDNKDITAVLFTLDWHTKYHCSFTCNGGTWPVHCVQHTWGSQIDTDLMNCIKDNDKEMWCIEKGTNVDFEEYGAFGRIEKTESNCNGEQTLHYNLFGQDNDWPYYHELDEDEIDIVICGIAGDYCVLETLKNLVSCGYFNIEILKDGIASIDGGKKLDEYVKELDLKYI